MKFLKVITFAVLTTFLFSCEKEDVSIVDNSTEATQIELAAKDGRFRQIRKLNHRLRIVNNNDKVFIVEIKPGDFKLQEQTLLYSINTKKLPKNFLNSGLKGYRFITERKFNSRAIVDHSYDLKRGVFADNKIVQKGQKLNVTGAIPKKDRKRVISFSIAIR